MADLSSTRREFIKGRAAIKAVETLVDTPQPLQAPKIPDARTNSAEDNTASGRQSAYMEQYSKPAMACQFELLFNMHQYPTAGNVDGLPRAQRNQPTEPTSVSRACEG